MAKKPAKHALLEQLIADGTRYIFGNPGTTEQGFMDALQDYPQLEFILALHEGVAVCAGDAYARATRRPAFVELHTAPGLGNGIGMIYNAIRGNTPLIIYAGHVDTDAVAQEPVLSGDLVGMAKTVCKWSAEAIHGSDVPQLIRRAMKIAADPPQGPVFLSLPMNVLEQETDTPVVPTPFTRWRVRPEPAAVSEAAAVLAAAHHPIVIVGDGIALADAQSELTALAELTGAMIVGTFTSEVNVPYDHQLWFGGLNLMQGEIIRTQLEGADVILMVGTADPAAVFPARGGMLPPEARVVQVHIDSSELGKNTAAEIAIIADPKAALAELADAVRGRQSPESAQEARRRTEELSARRRADEEAVRRQEAQRRDQMPIAGSRLWEELAAVLPEGAAIYDESITTGQSLQRYIQVTPGRYFRARGGGIGSGLPGAIGLQLAFPGVTTVGLESDGSAMYNITALWTAAHHRLPIKWIICNNRRYRTLEVNVLNYLGEAGANRKLMATTLSDPDIDFATIAEGMGVRGRRVERPEDLGQALRETFAHPGPALLDVIVDGSIPGRG